MYQHSRNLSSKTECRRSEWMNNGQTRRTRKTHTMGNYHINVYARTRTRARATITSWPPPLLWPRMLAMPRVFNDETGWNQSLTLALDARTHVYLHSPLRNYFIVGIHTPPMYARIPWLCSRCTEGNKETDCVNDGCLWSV